MFACMRTRVMGNAEIGQKGAEKMTAEDVKKSLIRQLEDRGANVEHLPVWEPSKLRGSRTVSRIPYILRLQRKEPKK